MKTKLPIQTLLATSLLLVLLAPAAAQPVPPRGPVINPVTGLPALPPAQPAPQNPTPAIDPTTGLPLPAPEPQWIDPNWKDPDITLANLEYNGLPLSEVAKQLREQFKNQFDILPMPQVFSQDWGTITINLQLKNVKASEVFNAMNMVFENDRTPLRWELTMNFNRPVVQLRVLPEAAPQPIPPPKPPETHRMVYFVGDLLGDEKSGGMTMKQLVKTITDIWPPDLGKPEGVIQFHNEAQLLVANGTPEQLMFIAQTLAGLHQRAEWQRHKEKSDDAIDTLKSNLKNSGGGGN